MPKIRLDTLPLDQRQQAMGGQAIVNKREVDPVSLGEIKHRHGSVREAAGDSALGLISEGNVSYITSEQPVDLSANSGAFTALFNLKWGTLAEEGNYPILTLRAGTANTHWYQLYLNRTGDDLKFGLRAADSAVGTAQLQQTGTLTANSSAGIALKRVANRLSVFVDGVEKGYIADVSGDSPTGPFYIDLLGSVAGINGLIEKPNTGGTQPIISNLKLDSESLTVDSGDDAIRDADSYDFQWKLDGTYEAGYIPADVGTNPLLSIPSAPVVQGSALRFSGTAGALIVRHTPDLDYYFQTSLQSPNTGEFGFQVEGVQAIEKTRREVTLIDYGDLCKLVILADGKVSFTMNGVTVLTTNAQFTSTTAAYTFKIFCGRDNNNLYVRSEVTGETTRSGTNTADNYVPFLDFEDIPNIYVGSEASALSTKRFKGSLSKLAFYPTYYQTDGGDAYAEFAFDLTSSLLQDNSPKNRTAELMAHYSLEPVDPTYSQGGLTDAEFLTVEAGVVLSASGPINYNSKLTRRLSDDVTSSRLGQLTFLESDGTVHVINHQKNNARTLGIPKPNRLITQEAVGGGALSGAYSYGYRFVSDLETKGPLLRLDPIKTGASSRIKLGAPADPDTASLGDTWLVTPKDTPSAGSVEFSSPLDKNTEWPLELYAKAGETTESMNFKEKIWHRGCTMPNSGSLVSNSNAIAFDTGENWTIQVAFKYGKAWHSNYSAICGIGPSGNYEPNDNLRLSSPNHDNGRYRIPDFAAYIDHGSYGGSGGRLVVCTPKRDKWAFEYEGYSLDWNDGDEFYWRHKFLNNVKTATFSNDIGYWEEGALYNLVFIKSGSGLKVHCNKYDNLDGDGVGEVNTQWKELTGAAAGGGRVSTNSLFSGVAIRSATGFACGQVPRLSAWKVAMDSAGVINNHSNVGFTSSSYNAQLVREQSGGGPGKFFAFRVWTKAKTLGEFKNYGEDRFACDEDSINGGQMASKCLIDLFPQCSDDEQTSSTSQSLMINGAAHTFTVKISKTVYTFSNFEMIAETGSRLKPKQAMLACLGDLTVSTYNPYSNPDPGLKIFLSDIGNGSLIVQAGSISNWELQSTAYEEGRWLIMTDVWNESLLGSNDNTVSRASLGFVNDWDEFNWISTKLVVLPSQHDSYYGADTRALRLDGLVINGNQVFSSSIGGKDSAHNLAFKSHRAGNSFIRLGNWGNLRATPYAVASHPVEVHVGSFRMWDQDKGPDPVEGTGYDYLEGRVAPSKYGDLRHYYQMQPMDWNDLSTDTVDDYGDAATPVALLLEHTATLSRLPGAAQATISFPTSAHETIAAIEIFRTAAVPIAGLDTADETEEDIQTALNIARTVDQKFLARIPIGTGQYIDNSPDSALGEVGDYTTGYVPEGIISAFIWNSRLVLIDENNRLWPSEPGPLSWESFPSSVPIPNLSTKVTAALNIQGERNQPMVILLGKSAGVILSGSPDAPAAHMLGGGVGAENQKCITEYNGMAFAFNGTLWAIQQGQAIDFGGPVQELLPTPANARVATSAKLSSLFVLDTDSGTCLRYHFPTKQWTVEERYATSVGDLEDGTDAWISQYGSWSKGNTAVYGDDVQDDTPSTNTGTISGTAFSTTGDLSGKVHVGMRVGLIDDETPTAGFQETTITNVTSSVITVANADSITDGVATMYFGTGMTGLLLDTGPIDVGDDSVISPKLLVDNLTGTGWEYAVHATKHPGDRDVTPALTYTSMSTDSGYRASGVRGRFQRVVIRNRKREAAQIPLLEIDLK